MSFEEDAVRDLRKLKAEISRLRLSYREMCDCAEEWETTAERLQAALEEVARIAENGHGAVGASIASDIRKLSEG
jgi:broad specificity phosphatase PhoE